MNRPTSGAEHALLLVGPDRQRHHWQIDWQIVSGHDVHGTAHRPRADQHASLVQRVIHVLRRDAGDAGPQRDVRGIRHLRLQADYITDDADQLSTRSTGVQMLAGQPKRHNLFRCDGDESASHQSRVTKFRILPRGRSG